MRTNKIVEDLTVKAFQDAFAAMGKAIKSLERGEIKGLKLNQIAKLMAKQKRFYENYQTN